MLLAESRDLVSTHEQTLAEKEIDLQSKAQTIADVRALAETREKKN